jgi:hypothetical protein
MFIADGIQKSAVEWILLIRLSASEWAAHAPAAIELCHPNLSPPMKTCPAV